MRKFLIFFTLILTGMNCGSTENKSVSNLNIKAGEFSPAGSPGKLLYRIYSPEIKAGEKYPVVIYLHGAGGRGNDNLSQIGANVHFFTDSSLQRNHPCFVVAPQCPKGTQWVNTKFAKAPFSHYNQDEIPESNEVKMIISLIDSMIASGNIDSSRLYLVGFSMGSSGIWDIITRYPGKFAATINISGVSDTSKAFKVKDTSVWAFNGENDNIAPPALNAEMVNLIIKHGGFAKHTVFKESGHDCCAEVFKMPYLTDWLFKQSR